MPGVGQYGLGQCVLLHSRLLVPQGEDVLELGVRGQQVAVEDGGYRGAVLLEYGGRRLDDVDLLLGESHFPLFFMNLSGKELLSLSLSLRHTLCVYLSSHLTGWLENQLVLTERPWPPGNTILFA